MNRADGPGRYDGPHRGGRRGGRRGRGRDHRGPRVPEKTPEQLMLQAFVSLGDLQPGEPVTKEAVAATAALADIRQDLRNEDLQHYGPMMIDAILSCAVEVPTKTALYATLVGLLNLESVELVAALLEEARSRYDHALNSADMPAARLLLRFFASLARANVLPPASVATQLQALVSCACDQGKAAKDNLQDDGRCWQPWADALVAIALSALPWGGPELAEAASADVGGLLLKVDEYMALRKYSFQTGTRPLSATAPEQLDADNPLAGNDSGGASWLGMLLEAVQQLKDASWACACVVDVHGPFRDELAGAESHMMAVVHPPAEVPGLAESLSEEERAAQVAKALPVRGFLRLIPREHTEGDRLLIDRIIAEDYILDTIWYFQADRVECSRRLATQLPLPWPSCEHLLVETLVAQLLRLPQPAFKPVLYAVLIQDLCRLNATLTRGMSTCVRQLFNNMRLLDVELKQRLAVWLAHHISSFQWIWPWQRWQHVLKMPGSDAQRRFCQELLSRLARLSFQEHMQKILQDDAWRQLAPGAGPLLDPLPGVPDHRTPRPPQQAPPQGADGKPAEAAEEEPQQQQQQQQPQVEAALLEAGMKEAEVLLAGEVVLRVRQKVVAAELQEWLEGEMGREGASVDAVGALRGTAHALLFLGWKSLTHLIVALERYQEVLRHLIDKVGPHEGKVEVMATAARVWRRSQQRVLMCVDRMLTLRLIDSRAVVEWAFASPGIRNPLSQVSSATTMEVLHHTVNRQIERVQDIRRDHQQLQSTITHALQQAELAAAKAAELLEAGNAAHAGQEVEGNMEAVQQAAEEERLALQAVGRLKGELPTQEQELQEASSELSSLLCLIFRLFCQVAEDAQDEPDAPDVAQLAEMEAQAQAVVKKAAEAADAAMDVDGAKPAEAADGENTEKPAPPPGPSEVEEAKQLLQQLQISGPPASRKQELLSLLASFCREYFCEVVSVLKQLEEEVLPNYPQAAEVIRKSIRV